MIILLECQPKEKASSLQRSHTCNLCRDEACSASPAVPPLLDWALAKVSCRRSFSNKKSLHETQGFATSLTRAAREFWTPMLPAKITVAFRDRLLAFMRWASDSPVHSSSAPLSPFQQPETLCSSP